jgi:2'-hydroxyisoflavone reductase
MRLLILGGTRFLGRHAAAAALARGWDVTLFNRGIEDAQAFPEAEHLRGDRDGDLSALAGREWDAVIDTSGYVPRVVRASAEALEGSVGRYVFVSSASVYADPSWPGLAEGATLTVLDDPASEDVGAHYDGLKALCERVVRDVYGERATCVRPGLIVGPHDPTNRLTYWVTRIAAAGRVLAPEPRDQPVQVIDARDLAEWMLDLAEGPAPGALNAVGDVSTMERLLEAVKAVTGSDAELAWLPEWTLVDAGVEAWSDLPLWLAPGANPDFAGFLSMDNALAKQHGLRLRPLEDTIRATSEWAKTAPPAAGVRVGTLESPPAGLSSDVEARLLGEFPPA